MRKYLEDKKFYVKNDSNLIYEVKSFEAYDGYNSLHFHLELVCGHDYINPDENDIQGYVKADRFIDDVQTETVIQYFFEEGLKDCLKENGWEILETLPKIY